MPAFERKQTRIVHSGMNWARPIDAIPPEQVCFSKNARVYQDGTVRKRPGLTSFSNVGGSYTHTISRLNNYNPQLNLDYTYFIGTDTNLRVGQTTAALTNGALNPVITNLSGNPISLVDSATAGGLGGFKYLADSTRMSSVGYYPGDNVLVTPARVLDMGIAPPISTSIIPAVGAGGTLVGAYQWAFVYRNKVTGAQSNPSPPTRVTLASPALTLASQKANITLPSSADSNVVVDIYRYGGTLASWHLVGSAPGSTAWVDNLADAEILTAPSPSVTTDAAGVQRYDLFRPFPQPDISRFGTGSLTQNGNNVYILNWTSGDQFNTGWLPGSVIGVNNAPVLTIRQVISATQIEIDEDATSAGGVGGPYPYSTPAGTLIAGQPVRHLWGPFGTGQSGAVLFGCGSRLAPGTLFWTNGNDPDSSDIANSIVVTSPSEPLVNGCMFDGRAFVWSTERMFEIFPSLSTAGQYIIQPIAGVKGIWAEWSLTVQSNEVGDVSISWVGKDGIYNYSAGSGAQSLTTRDMYPFFPHDNQVGTDVIALFAFLGVTTGSFTAEAVGAPSYTAANLKYHRLCWHDGILFYDFVGVPTAANIYSTLVYDTRLGGGAGGWASLDQYAYQQPVSRAPEVAANNLKIGIGGIVYDYTGTDDAGLPFTARLTTRADDLGDPKATKLWGDCMADISSAPANTLQVMPRIDYHQQTLTAATLTAANRTQLTLDLVSTGLGQLSTTFGLDWLWTSAGTVIYQYDPTWVPKPELTFLRATDKTDDGYNGAKYLRGVCIECNTLGFTRTIAVVVDGNIIANLSVTANGQFELPFGVSPTVGAEFQLQPRDALAWQLFQVRWVWEKWPDLANEYSPILSLGTSQAKYVRGVKVPIETQGAPVAFALFYDDTSVALGSRTGSIGKKTTVFFAIGPLVAHTVQLVPGGAARIWWDEAVWDFEPWPELVAETYPWMSLGTSGAKYLRGVEVPVDTNQLAARLQIRTESGIVDVFAAVNSLVANTKRVFPFTPSAPLIAHEYQLQSLDPMRVWYEEAKWDFEEWPELSDGRTPFTDCGQPGAKFVQGFVAPLDTDGNPVQIAVLTETGIALLTGPFTTLAGVKSPQPWSFPAPFVAHELQMIPQGDCRIWDKEIKWIYEPMPEMVTTYTTQETDHDLDGWHSLGPDGYIAYIGTAAAPTFTVTTEYGSQVYTLPISNGAYTRAYVRMLPQKAKWRRYSIVCSSGIRLYLRDCQVGAKQWNSDGPYQQFQPFGDVSRVNGALI